MLGVGYVWVHMLPGQLLAQEGWAELLIQPLLELSCMGTSSLPALPQSVVRCPHRFTQPVGALLLPLVSEPVLLGAQIPYAP